MTRLFLPLVLACCCATPCLGGQPTPEELDFFEKRIRPVLVEHCYECHSADAKVVQGNLRLDTRDQMREGGDSGSAVVPNQPAKSLLISALKYEGHQMPPSGRLPEKIIADFERWVAMGAPDPRDAVATVTKSLTDQEQRSKHWAFQPLASVPIPEVRNAAWPRSPLDRFILARIEADGLSPAIDAKPQALVRRLYFDLIGLPPTPVEMEVFEQAALRSPQSAIESLVDRLLASPQFGVRWARHWLDIARYSESNGGDRNVIWPHAWRYRQYVIDAFNADLPYDDFLREQLAGDLLPANEDRLRDRRLVATGLLTLGPKLFMEPHAERFRLDVVDEQIDVVTRGMLGLTVSCARCHDHKFDPISTRDYYALAGIFESTIELRGQGAPAGNQLGHDRPLQPIGAGAEKLHAPAESWKKAVAEQTAVRNKARSDRYRVVRAQQAQENKLKALVAEKSGEQQADQADVTSLRAEIDKLAAEIKDWDAKIAELDKQLKALESSPPPMPDYCMAAADVESPADTWIRVRGEAGRHGQRVPRGVPSVPAFGESPDIAAGESGRRQLADWITDPRNPLTPRVAVNRVWQHLFGEGLVRSVDNFGTMGEAPSHPELLDWLAARFQQQGWSVKRLIREIVLSRTYGLSSVDSRSRQQDPDNRLLARASVRRLEAEPLRDAMLAVSGHLDLQPPASSPVAAFGELEFNDRVVLTAEQLQRPQRSVYLPIARMSLPETLELFDFADPSLLIGRRTQRTTPAQQLYFLNSPLVWRTALATAEQLLASGSTDDAELVHELWRRALARTPSRQEQDRSLGWLAKFQRSPAEFVDASLLSRHDSRTLAWAGLCQTLLASAEFRHLE